MKIDNFKQNNTDCIGNSIYYFEEKERKYFNKGNKKNLARSISRRHEVDILTSIVLLFCYHDVFQKYGRLIPTVESNENIYTNQMGIMFTADIDDDYLNEIKSLFLDGSYEYSFYDYLHYNNIGKIDIKEIKRRYPNLNLGSIRDITLYSKNDLIREKLFSFMNCVGSEFQIKICSLIKPIIIELTAINRISFDSDLIDIVMNIINDEVSKKYNMIMNIINGGISKQDDITGLNYSSLNSMLKNNNLVYMHEYEYIFQELLIDMLDKINEDNIDILIKAKEYSLQNIPEVTGELTWEPNYVMKSYEYSDADREAACGEVHTVYEEVQHGYKAVCNICYNEEKIKNEKIGIIKIVKMLIDEDVNYKELFKCDCSLFINGLIDFINDKEKVKKICK